MSLYSKRIHENLKFSIPPTDESIVIRSWPDWWGTSLDLSFLAGILYGAGTTSMPWTTWHKTIRFVCSPVELKYTHDKGLVLLRYDDRTTTDKTEDARYLHNLIQHIDDIIMNDSYITYANPDEAIEFTKHYDRLAYIRGHVYVCNNSTISEEE